jgi:Tfp pilus assembly protein FimT
MPAPPRLTRRPSPRRGATLLEIAIVCTVVAVLAAVAAPRTAQLVDRLRVRGAVEELAAACAAARQLAILRGQFVTVSIDVPAGAVTVATSVDTVIRRRLTASFGVALAATGSAVTYAPTGLGYGVSNLSVAVSRGRAADTVFVSRLGRVRR